MGDESAEREPSWGNVSERHWSRARKDENREAIEHYRERSQAPGVAKGGGPRNHYCMSCKGVIPLEYDQREPASGPPEHCPHCGAELDPRVREMFNWVEIDQVPSGDAGALVPVAVAGVAVLVLVALIAWWFLR